LLKSKFVTDRQGLNPTRSFDVNVTNTTYAKNIVDAVVINDPKVAILFH
jgi:hypothetical protein